MELMKAWRICRKKHAPKALSGEGARLFGGRWNHKVAPMVYCSSSLSLAALEVLVHTDPINLPSDLVTVEAAIPSHVPITQLEEPALPDEWAKTPGPTGIKDLGTRWLESAEAAVLVVPSAIIPEEKNILLNPLHPGVFEISHREVRAFLFDSRLAKPSVV